MEICANAKWLEEIETVREKEPNSQTTQTPNEYITQKKTKKSKRFIPFKKREREGEKGRARVRRKKMKLITI